MRAHLKLMWLAALILGLTAVVASAKCPDPKDPRCLDSRGISIPSASVEVPIPAQKPVPAPTSVGKPRPGANAPGEGAFPAPGNTSTEHKTHARPPVATDEGPLQPVRDYLSEADIPPPGVGAYGIVVLKARPTSATRARLTMICQSFQAHFDRNETIPSSVPASDRMVTIWPVDNPQADKVKADDCDFVLDHYVLHVADMAMADAEKQGAKFDSEGPYLVGWSPASTRGERDKLVLVIDFSRANDQATIDHDFDFWKEKIVRDPSLWRHGFTIAGMRQSIKDFADHYGSQIIDAVKMAGL